MINPYAVDTCDDGIDQDCDGVDSAPGSCDCPVSITESGDFTGDTPGMGSTLDGYRDSSQGAYVLSVTGL